MNKMMQTLVALIIVFTMLLSGCKSAQQTTESNGNGAPSSDADSKEKSSSTNTKAEQEAVEFDAFISRTRVVKDYNTNEFIKWREEETGIKINFDQVLVDQADERRNLIMSTGEYPDLMINARMDLAQVNTYGSEGVFIRLNELIDEHMPNLKAFLDDNPYVIGQISDMEGNIYCLPTINFTYHVSHPRKIWIYEPWLEALDLEMPQTTEEFEAVLKAFKEMDPNGNGEADEIPAAGAIKGWEANIVGFLMSSFQIEDFRVSNRNAARLINNNGSIEFTANTEGYREGLRYIKSLYDQGLIAEESFTQDQKQLKQMGENPDVHILGVGAYGWFGGMTISGGESGRYLEFTSVPPLEGPGGLRQTHTVLPTANPGAMITEKCDDPVTAVKWFDYLYTVEGSLNAATGLDGWSPAEEGKIGLNGKPAKYNVTYVFGEEQNSAAYDMPQLLVDEVRGAYVANDPNGNEERLYTETLEKYEPYAVDVSLPILQFSEDEQIEEVEIRTSLISFVDSAEARFIVGDIDIDDDWDEYITELKNRGLDRYIEIYQNAYDNKVQ